MDFSHLSVTLSDDFLLDFQFAKYILTLFKLKPLAFIKARRRSQYPFGNPCGRELCLGAFQFVTSFISGFFRRHSLSVPYQD